MDDAQDAPGAQTVPGLGWPGSGTTHPGLGWPGGTASPRPTSPPPAAPGPD
ncbi:hypothetical protein [Geodermatophilus sp. TF02-6]|uniref:hypothetical protein n=1 Tax=Geodermatophilus sp. TF02-6 TaxID=2250575 RepID=UPI0013144562|nr:hypothetical protein [Geodermatophilus sp. TF02-6]